MSEPLAICIEDLEPSSPAVRYLRCVAVPGRRPGLRIDRAGAVLWRSDDDVACELCVSGDDKLILYRPEGAAPVVVRREGRWLDVPAGKPVVLLDRDRVEVGPRRLRVHVHGTARTVAAPSFLPVPESRGFGRSVAAAVALGAALGAAGCAKKPADERQVPPVPPPDAGTLPAAPDVPAAPPGLDGGPAIDTTPPVEVRVAPPMVAPSVDLAPPPADAGSVDAAPDAAVAPDAGADPDAASPVETVPEDVWDGALADDVRRVRDVPRIEVRNRPPIAVQVDDDPPFEK
jgi:hypothetical protein